MGKLEDAYIDRNNSCLKIYVVNLDKLKELAERAKKEAQQLSNTIGELERFALDIRSE